MGWLVTILLLVGGAIAASSFIVAKKPNAKEALDKLLPYQTGIGLALLGFGIYWTIFGTFMNMSWVTAFFKMGVMGMLLGISWFAGGPVMLITGFLLSYGFIAKKTAEKKPELSEKMENTRKKLAAYVTPLGFLCIIFGVIFLLFNVSPGMFMKISLGSFGIK